MVNGHQKNDSVLMANQMRQHALRMVHAVDASHIGSGLSIADTLAVLYTGILRVRPKQPRWPARDRFILSKGHAAAILYAALAEAGFFPVSELAAFSFDGSTLMGHVSHHDVPGVEVSTGSLGHGLPISAGMALAVRADKTESRVFCLISDGELNEGTTWEAAQFCSHHELDNLIVIIDYNKIQSYGRTAEVINPEPITDRFCAFGWAVREVDGHDHEALRSLLQRQPFEKGKPGILITHTIKGKGVSFMENKLEWHYRSPSKKQLAEAIAQLQEKQQ